MTYATTEELSRFMGILSTIPNYQENDKEEVGTGDDSKTIFWLNNLGIVSSSYTLFYGADNTTTDELIETTDYTLDLEISKITLTSAGVTKLGTNKIFAEYSYNTLQLTNQLLLDAVTRAEEEVDNFTNNHFVDSSVATPDWIQHLDQDQEGKGVYQRDYFTLQNYPIPDVTAVLNGAITADDETITVVSTDGFPSSGNILIEGDKINYTSKDETTFIGCTSVSAHDDGLTVKAYVIEISSTRSGGNITWDVLEEGTGFEFDQSTGKIHVYARGYYAIGQYYDDLNSAPKGIPNRLRVSFLQGTSDIPVDITKATLMIASRDMMALAVRKAHSQGMNDFKPSLLNVDKDEALKIIMHYRNEQYARC